MTGDFQHAADRTFGGGNAVDSVGQEPDPERPRVHDDDALADVRYADGRAKARPNIDNGAQRAAQTQQADQINWRSRQRGQTGAGYDTRYLAHGQRIALLPQVEYKQIVVHGLDGRTIGIEDPCNPYRFIPIFTGTILQACCEGLPGGLTCCSTMRRMHVRMTGGEALAQQLVREGISQVFG